MAGRDLAFSDPDVIELLTEEFVPAVGDDFYRRRQDDQVGRFFRMVADQSPRTGLGGTTRQGIYAFTADGELLAFEKAYSPNIVEDMLERALDQWDDLDKNTRRQRPFELVRGDLDPRYNHVLPEDAVVLRAYARELEIKDGTYVRAPARDEGRRNLASLDHVWLRAQDWMAMLPPTSAATGTSYPVPESIARRLARFHLVDNTRGEPPMWLREDVVQLDLRLRVAELSADRIVLNLSGEAHLEHHADRRGYVPALGGTLVFDRALRVFTRFTVVAVGDHWGQGAYTMGARPGRQPLGVAFELADGSVAADRVPPQAARNIEEYFGP